MREGTRVLVLVLVLGGDIVIWRVVASLRAGYEAGIAAVSNVSTIDYETML
jgi:hypothetical protein